jgi:hypothetical protein
MRRLFGCMARGLYSMHKAGRVLKSSRSHHNLFHKSNVSDTL